MRMLSERAIEMHRDAYLCFINYEKTFNTVKREEMLRMLSKSEVDERDVRMVRNLYYQQRSAVRGGDELTEPVDIKQGCDRGMFCLSIFSRCTER